MRVRTLCVVLAAAIVLPVESLSQEARLLGIHVGYRNPKATRSGVFVGASYGFFADETVDLSAGFDYFRRSYSELTEVAKENFPSGVEEVTVRKTLDYRTTILPLYGTVTIRIPLDYSKWLYLRGGVGYTFLFNHERNYEDNVEAKRTYHGMSWRFGSGLMLRLGTRSVLEVGVLYHSAEVSREKKESPQGLPVWKSVDLSGIAVSAGVKLELY